MNLDIFYVSSYGCISVKIYFALIWSRFTHSLKVMQLSCNVYQFSRSNVKDWKCSELSLGYIMNMVIQIILNTVATDHILMNTDCVYISSNIFVSFWIISFMTFIGCLLKNLQDACCEYHYTWYINMYNSSWNAFQCLMYILSISHGCYFLPWLIPLHLFLM